MHLTVFLMAVVGVVACGDTGLAADDPDTAAAASADAAASAASGASTEAKEGLIGINSGGTKWSVCAAENSTCSFSGIREVRFGTPTQYVTYDMAGPVACNTTTFGDPAVGIVKSCTMSSEPTWVACAAENATCSFSGIRDVRFGTTASYVIKRLNGAAACNTTTFGDPAVGSAKSCWYSDAVNDPSAAIVSTDPCETMPALPTVPANARLVTASCVNGQCALPNNNMDDTAAIQAAIDAAPGGFLVFPPGTYQISSSLRINSAGITLWGPGAIIHGTNPADQSIIIQADNVSIYNFEFTAVTTTRGSTAEQSRIAIYGPTNHLVVSNTVIRNNWITYAGNPGTNLANSSSATGIFINNANGFLVAGNTVNRTLADGIHMTGGSRNGRVLNNTVSQTGDDMIAMVSYAYPDPNTNTAASIEPNFAYNLATYQDSNILVANNNVSGQYWGRGISVVGGANITIRGNTLGNIPYAAAILVARETQSGTYGVNNVLVENNTIGDEQTLNPPYNFNNTFNPAQRTGHGAFEVEDSMFTDELAYPDMVAGFAVSNITMRNNTVTSSATPGARLGVGTGSTWTQGSRQVTGTGFYANVAIDNTTMTGIRMSVPVQILSAAGTTSCQANTVSATALLAPVCTVAAPAPVATGASLSCTKY